MKKINKVWMILALFCLNVTVFAQTITIEKRNITVKQAMEELKSQSGYSFVFSSMDVNTKKKISISVEDEKVDEAIKQILAGQGLTYEITEKNIVVKKATSTKQVKGIKKEVTGRVVDANGESIPGATVMEKGAINNGTITSIDGDFSLNVSTNATIVISYIGYVTQDLSVEGKSTLDVTLQEDTQALEEVVVTALGIRREEKSLGYSVQKVSGDKLATVKTVDVATVLTGKIAGLNVQNSTEFNEAPTLTLRGESPLLVIDGVPYGNLTLRDIAPDDIQSIDVLKGATASALYGARGGSGAVMVTTKRGEKEGLNVSVNSSTMFNAGYLRIPEVQTSYSSGQAGKYSTGTYVWGDKLDIGREALQHNPSTYEWEMQPLVSKGKNNLQNFQEVGFITNNNISLTQKGKYGSFRTSLTHVYNKGQYPNETLNKLTFTASGQMKAGKFTSEAGVTYNKRFYPNMGGKGYGGSGYLYNLLVWSGAEFDVRDYKNYWEKEGELSNWMDRSWYENPYFIANEVTTSNDYNVVNSFINASYEIAPWLKATLRSGADMYSSKTEYKTPIGTGSGWGLRKGYYEIGQSSGFSINNDFLLMAEKKVGDFSFDGFVGGTLYYYDETKSSSNTENGLIIPEYYSLLASVDPAKTSKNFGQKQVNSIYGKASVSWRSTLFLDVTGRNDWSSTLPSETRSYFYPSISASIVLSELIPMPDMIDFWKIRGSWTETKKDIDVYSINEVYSISTNLWDNKTGSYTSKSMRDPLLSPSASRSYEIGTAMYFLKNRLRMDLAYYNKLNYNNTRSAGLSPTTGFNETLINMDEEQVRKGMEVTVSGDIIKNREVTWNAVFNWSRDRFYYGTIDETYSTQKTWVAEGERWDWISAYDYQRDPNGKIVHGKNGLPLINQYESIEGYSAPNWIWGLSTSLSYKNFTVDIAVDGRVGGTAFSTTDQAMWNSGSHIDSDNQYRYDEVVNGKNTFVGTGVKVISGTAEWDSDGNVINDNRVYAPNDIIISYENYQSNINPYVGSVRTQNLLDQTFIKLRNLSVSYALPKTLCEKIKMKGASVGFVGQNLWMWAKEFRFSDPDKASENLNAPSMRYVGFNIKIDL